MNINIPVFGLIWTALTLWAWWNICVWADDTFQISKRDHHGWSFILAWVGYLVFAFGSAFIVGQVFS